jgi:prepilin-type N-terminal cleavage/methylation domain-containing protein
MHCSKDRQFGFSLMELLLVVAITLVIVAISVPGLTLALENYRLDMAGHAAASLLVQTRLQAVRNNAPAYVQYNNASTPNIAYITNDPATVYSIGLPDIETVSTSFSTANLPDHTQLDTLLSNGNTGVVAEIGTVIGFNARGLPCLEGASAAVCQQLDANGNTAYFEWFMVDAKGGWEAVTVSPAGRVKAWRMSSSTGCGYPVCWQ